MDWRWQLVAEVSSSPPRLVPLTSPVMWCRSSVSRTCNKLLTESKRRTLSFPSFCMLLEVADSLKEWQGPALPASGKEDKSLLLSTRVCMEAPVAVHPQTNRHRWGRMSMEVFVVTIPLT